MVVTERRRKSRPRLLVDDDEESDGAHVDEEPLTGSRVRLVLNPDRITALPTSCHDHIAFLRYLKRTTIHL